MLTGSLPRYTSPAFVIWTTGNSFVLVETVFVFGTSMSIPYSITCAVIMKMISRTRATSTNGVTLISASGATPRDRRPPFIPPTFIATASVSETPLDQVQEFERKIVHARAHLFEHMAEVVVE